MTADPSLDALADEAMELDGYFSDAPLDPQPNYPRLDTSMENALVVLNLPKVPEAKVEKLTKFTMKLLSRIGNLVATDTFDGMSMPIANGSTLGFCLVAYETAEEAEKAVAALQDLAFDKNHSLTVIRYERALALQGLVPESFQEPEPTPFIERPNPTSWLEDPNQRDSYVIRHGRETQVQWWDPRQGPSMDYDGSRERQAGVVWCEQYCHWSPKGSYLATLVPARGVILWSGANYEKTGRFLAPGVRRILFSPNENYLLTSNEDPRDPEAVKIYHVLTEQLMRSFPLYPEDVSRDRPPPPYLWSHDDKYIACMGDGLIRIYETPGMKLLDQRSLAAEGVAEFQWSPSDNVLAYWAPEVNNSPAHVDLVDIPSRIRLRQKNLFNVTRCSMVWHEQGDYLAVKVTRHTKSKKTMFNNIELFRLREPGVPVEMLDIKDAVMALAWEPKGSRFAIIHAENPSASKVNVSFYDMIRKGEVVTIKGTKKAAKTEVATFRELTKLDTLEGRICNFLFWSPEGKNIILASLGESASGTLEFYDVDNKSMVVKEHYRCNQVVWDPAGRTVATIVSQPIEGGHFKFAMDNGYVLWSFQGKQLYQDSFETFYQFLWRPRESLLTKSEIRKVKNNLKKYEKQFEKEDKRRQRVKYLEETQGKRAERAQIRAVLERNRAARASRRTEYIALLGGYDSQDDANYIEKELVVETILSSKEEVIM
ncbi:hypothetical protein MPSEU_000167600 [Mayamaea pseudoterrestris]|nr:hypothetical protein MPSEU_000167600 [Mayamaea pseudoterrestris]